MFATFLCSNLGKASEALDCVHYGPPSIPIPSRKRELYLGVMEERMRLRTVILIGIALLMAETALAQEYDKREESLDYSYVRANPANVGKPYSLNGGGGGLAYNFNGCIAVKLDLQG
jgi:hypothetical protein